MQNLKTYFSRVNNLINALLIVFIININCSGCPYSFSGSSVPSHLKTIYISLFDDQSNFGEPGLREKITKSITDKFISDNSLTVGQKNSSDCTIDGSILRIVDKVSTVSKGEEVDKRRIEVTVKVTFNDMVKRKKTWEREFSNWGEYSSKGAVFSQRIQGINSAIEKIAEDVLLQTVSGW